MTANLDEQSAISNVFQGSDMGAESAAPGADKVEVEVPAQADPKPEQIVPTADEVKDDEAPLQGRDPQTGRFVPVTELVAERKKLRGEREAEAKLRIEAEANAKAYKEQVEHLQRQFTQFQQPQRQPQQQEQQPQIPDPILDPEGYANFQQRFVSEQILNIRLNMDEQVARIRHTDAVIDAALQAAHQAGIAHHFKSAAKPFEALVQWHKRQQMDVEIGGDLEAYKKRVADEAVKAALANLKAGGQPVAQPQAQAQRFPGTLADHTAQGDQGAVLTEAAAISGVFNRKRA